MTIEAKKKAFKSTWAVFIPTVILCWIICWFFNKPYALTDVTLASCAAASGVSCFITPLICGLIAYPINKGAIKKAIKAKMENPTAESAPAPEMGELESQMIFFNWIPKNWICYLLVFSVCTSVFFGYGLPNLLAAFIPVTVPAGVWSSRLFITLIGGLQIGFSAQFSGYLANVYFVKMLQKKLVPAAVR